jgi:chromate transport protein ChrA
MPGPMFNLSAYLGAVMAVRAGWNFLVGVSACWLGLFAPGIMLLYGLLPFWGWFRQLQAYRRALPGLSAAAVGLVVMAVFTMYNSFTCGLLPLQPLRCVCKILNMLRNAFQSRLVLVSCSGGLQRDYACCSVGMHDKGKYIFLACISALS